MLKKIGALALSTGLILSSAVSVSAVPPGLEGNPNANPNAYTNNGNGNGNNQEVENVIYMIPDGFGAAYAKNYRMYKGEDAVWDEHLKGLFSTQSANSDITDSAAAGTAMSSGVKGNNGVIGLDAEGNEVETILEAAQDEEMSTGLVATSTITHATPAAFASHVDDRNNETEIARQLIDNGVDVLLGGGKNNFIPQSEGGNQEDENLMEKTEQNNYSLVDTRNDLLNNVTNTVDVDQGENLLGLFADDALAPEMERSGTGQPSLAEMTDAAIDMLEEDEDGFFMMVEGSQIDWAGHDNDPAYAMTDTQAFERAVQEAIEFAEQDGETLVIVAPDHETGGMTVGTDGQMDLKPEVLKNVQATGSTIAGQLNADRTNTGEVVEEYTGIEPTDEEIQAIQSSENPAIAINTLISNRANIGWTSTGHTGVDVPLYAFGPGANAFTGFHDNTELPKIIADLTGIDLDTNE